MYSIDIAGKYTCSRYWGVPNFGSQTIHRFTTNASEMKNLLLETTKTFSQVHTNFKFLEVASNLGLVRSTCFEDLLPSKHK